MEPAAPLESGSDFERIRRRLVQAALGYVALACLAVYVDYRIRLRRARKKLEADKKGRDPQP